MFCFFFSIWNQSLLAMKFFFFIYGSEYKKLRLSIEFRNEILSTAKIFYYLINYNYLIGTFILLLSAVTMTLLRFVMILRLEHNTPNRIIIDFLISYLTLIWMNTECIIQMNINIKRISFRYSTLAQCVQTKNLYVSPLPTIFILSMCYYCYC